MNNEDTETTQDVKTTMEHPGVLVVRVKDDDQERIEIVDLNGLDPWSIPSLLRAAAKIYESRLGL